MDQVIGERDACWRLIPKRRRRPESRWDIDRAYEDGCPEQSGRWCGLSGRGRRLRLDHPVCGWSRILRAGCIDTQRNVVVELFLHSSQGNRKDSSDLSDTRGIGSGSLRCFLVTVSGRLHGSWAGGDHNAVRRSGKNMCHDANLMAWSSISATGLFPKTGGFLAKCDHLVCFLTSFGVLLLGFAMFSLCVDSHLALNCAVREETCSEKSPMLADTGANRCCFSRT